jgi:hypothetical protein
MDSRFPDQNSDLFTLLHQMRPEVGTLEMETFHLYACFLWVLLETMEGQRRGLYVGGQIELEQKPVLTLSCSFDMADMCKEPMRAASCYIVLANRLDNAFLDNKTIAEL